MGYEVIKVFTDLADNNYPYTLGNTYPREGLEPTGERIAELSGNKNKRGISLIKEIKEPDSEVKKEVKEPKGETKKAVSKAEDSKKKAE